MFLIIRGSEIISVCEKVRYIRFKEFTECYVDATAENAEGVVVDNVIYNLIGKTAKEGAESVYVAHVDDSTKYLWDKLTSDNNAFREENDMLTECILEMSEIIYGE